MKEIVNQHGNRVRLNISDSALKHIHFDHVLAGYDLSPSRSCEPREPWDTCLPPREYKYLHESRTQYDYDIFKAWLENEAVEAMLKPLTMKYQRGQTIKGVFDGQRQLQVICQSGLMMVGSVLDDVWNLKTAFFHQRVCQYVKSNILSERSNAQLHRPAAICRLQNYLTYSGQVEGKSVYRIPANQAESPVISSPGLVDRRVRFDSKENWGFNVLGQHSLEERDIPAWQTKQEPASVTEA